MVSAHRNYYRISALVMITVDHSRLIERFCLSFLMLPVLLVGELVANQLMLFVIAFLRN